MAMRLVIQDLDRLELLYVQRIVLVQIQDGSAQEGIIIQPQHVLSR